MAAPFYPRTSASRFYSAPPNSHSVGMNYIWDEDAVISGQGPAINKITGCWRPCTPEDFSDITFSGAVNVSVAAVAITGSPLVRVADVAVTGSLSVSVAAVAITGTAQSPLTINSGTYTTTFAYITGSQVIVPVGQKSVSVAVESGTCYINGTQLNAGLSFQAGGYDGRWISAAAYTVGVTGGSVFIAYE